MVRRPRRHDRGKTPLAHRTDAVLREIQFFGELSADPTTVLEWFTPEERAEARRILREREAMQDPDVAK